MRPKYLLVLMASLFLASKTACAEFPGTLDGIIRDSIGSVLKMDQESAIKACRKFGMELPTIYQLVQMQGAGICKPDPNICGDQADLATPSVQAINPDGKSVEFRYISFGYQPPDGDAGKQAFWSSSGNSIYTGTHWVFHGDVGVATVENSSHILAVRCVDSQGPR